MAARQADADEGGRCGRCGYDVRELTSFTCPECGSDLRRVGIVLRETARRRARALIAPVAWTLTVLVAAVTLSPVLHARYWPFERVARQQTVLRPESRGYQILYTVEDRSTHRGRPPAAAPNAGRTIEVTFAPGQAPAVTFVVSDDGAAAGRLRYHKLTPAGGVPSEGAFTLRFMGDVLGASASGEEAELAYLLIAGHAPAGSGDPRGSPMSRTIRSFAGSSPTVGPVVTVTERWPFVPLVVVAWLVVWALGATYLVRLARGRVGRR